MLDSSPFPHNLPNFIHQDQPLFMTPNMDSMSSPYFPNAQLQRVYNIDQKCKMNLMAKTKNGEGLPTLQFNNSTTSLSTRCDVVYKTLLRDCRRYYNDKFQVKKMHKNKRAFYLTKTLKKFVDENFSNRSTDDKRELEFYLGSLVNPKEMMDSEVTLYGSNGQVLKGTERTQKLKKVIRVYAVLYNYSMDKCENFFDNKFLSMLFQNYAQDFEQRIAICSTIENNQDVYRSTLSLIGRRISANIYYNF
jgi:hypothetical protein